MRASITGETVLDVRQIAPRMRHPLIFGAFNQLNAGEAFEIVNDHDPQTLLYYFNVKHAGRFSWDYRENGPDIWRVRIGRED